MKTTTMLSLAATLALVSMAASIGCSSAPPPDFGDGTDTDEKPVKGSSTSSSSSGSTGKTGTSSSSSSSSGSNASSGAPAAPTTPPAAPTTPPGTTPTTPPAGGDPEACFTQCIASNPQAAKYDTCAIACAETDNACEEGCWNNSGCAQNEQACDTALNQCGTQCFGAQEGDPNQP